MVSNLLGPPKHVGGRPIRKVLLATHVSKMPMGWWSWGEWYGSVKVDGERAVWDATANGGRGGLFTSYANPIHAPDWWIKDWGCAGRASGGSSWDGELWIERGGWRELRTIVSRTVNVLDMEWERVKYVKFERIEMGVPFKDTMVRDWEGCGLPQPKLISSFDEALELCSAEVDAGGEGYMLRLGSSCWRAARMKELVKLKAEVEHMGTVTGWSFGVGRLRELVGSLTVVLDNGLTVSVGSGLSDVQRGLFDSLLGRRIKIVSMGMFGAGKLREPRVRRLWG